jgi:hypothetical protein
MALGPREKSDLELHWQHQQDHVRADIKNIYRRMQNQAERAAFKAITDHFQRTGKLLDLTEEQGFLVKLARKAAAELPEGS